MAVGLALWEATRDGIRVGLLQRKGRIHFGEGRRRPWFVVTLLLALCVASPASAAAEDELATVFLVRHAEKVEIGDDPALSEAGEERAEALANLLRDAGIGAIYTTDYVRTRETAAPLASMLGLGLTLYEPEKLEELAAEIRQRGGRCLVVGHSNTTPFLTALLGGDPGEPIDEESEYDRLYVVTMAPGGVVSTVVLRYWL
jgi:phosphohistidine phosphatase SixA